VSHRSAAASNTELLNQNCVYYSRSKFLSVRRSCWKAKFHFGRKRLDERFVTLGTLLFHVMSVIST